VSPSMERRVVFYPHQRGRQGVVADHLRGQLLGGVGYRGAVVSGQLGADNYGRVLIFLGKVDAHPASSAARSGVYVICCEVHLGMIPAWRRLPMIVSSVSAGVLRGPSLFVLSPGGPGPSGPGLCALTPAV
jgi:hypothetical protein